MWGQNIGTREVPLLRLFFILLCDLWLCSHAKSDRYSENRSTRNILLIQKHYKSITIACFFSSRCSREPACGDPAAAIQANKAAGIHEARSSLHAPATTLQPPPIHGPRIHPVPSQVAQVAQVTVRHTVFALGPCNSGDPEPRRPALVRWDIPPTALRG